MDKRVALDWFLRRREMCLSDKCQSAENVAIEAIQDSIANEPRVLALDEVVDLPEDSVVWLEDNDKTNVIAGLLGDSRVGVNESGCVVMLIRFIVIRDGGIIKVTGNAEDYKIRWRC